MKTYFLTLHYLCAGKFLETSLKWFVTQRQTSIFTRLHKPLTPAEHYLRRAYYLRRANGTTCQSEWST